MRIRRLCFVLGAALLLARPAAALECSSPTLKAASGVIGNKHRYKIAGDCAYTWSETKTGIGTSTTTSGSLSFSYVGSAEWNRLTGEAEEEIKFTGDASGIRLVTANCSQDPFLKDPPGGAAKCGQPLVQVKIESGNIYELITKGGFWAAKKLSLAEAQALSALPPPSKPPPAEKPKTQPVSSSSTPADTSVGGVATTGVTGGPVTVSSGSTPADTSVGGVATTGGSGRVSADSPPQDVAGRAAVIERMQRGDGTAQRVPAESQRATQPATGGMARASGSGLSRGNPVQMEVEAEALVQAGSYQLNGGQARVQPMGSFGGNWSGGKQLFWSEGTTGAVLDLVIDVPAASKYAVEIYMTRAPDYGRLGFEVDGQASTVPFDGMAPQVLPSGPIQVGTFPLQAGQHRVSLMITGKHPQSANYYVGIDKLRFYPAGPIN